VFGGRHRYSTDDSWVKRHSLSLFLLALLVAQSIAAWFLTWPVWAAEQTAHGGQAVMWPDYARYFASEWFLSVLAEPSGLLAMTLATVVFYERGSAESK
jgi:hypothetical protein